jgi:hypothetical protein
VLDYGCPKEKEGMPRSMTQKKREREKGVAMSEKNEG